MQAPRIEARDGSAAGAAGTSRLTKRIWTGISNPWGRPRAILVVTWLYVFIALVPVIIAIQFSFNSTRSLAVWHGFSMRWYWGDPAYSVWHNDALRHSLIQSLKIAVADMMIAVPLGTMLALGLTRWRGRAAKPASILMLVPLVTPELVMGVALFLLFVHVFQVVHLGTPAQVLGHVTFSMSYVVIIVRGRLVSIGTSYEEAAADLGASPFQTLRLVLLPLLYPAIVASWIIVFALSIDDFVISAWLSAGSGTETLPVVIYAATRGTPLPSTNALATIMLGCTLLSLVLGIAAYSFLTRGERKKKEKGGVGGLIDVVSASGK